MAAPPSSPCLQRYGCCHCCLCAVIVIVVLIGGATIILTDYMGRSTAATAVSAMLSRFDLTDGPSGGRGGGTLQYNLTVDIRVRNTLRDGNPYDHVEAQASYDAQLFGYNPLEPFYLEGKSERTVTVAFGGSSPVDDANTMRTYWRERSEGFYFVNVRLYYRAELKGRYSTDHVKMKISCTLRLPVPDTNTSATPVATKLETMCDAGY